MNNNNSQNSKSLEKEADKDISAKYLVNKTKINLQKNKFNRKNQLHITITKTTKFLYYI